MLINHERLREFVKKIFEQAGASEDRAWQVAEHLVEANLKGHDSHGVGMIPNYVNGIQRGYLRVNEDAELVVDKGAVLLVDGHFGFGQVVAKQATQMGIERAKQIGMACVGSKK
jgi:uncharacterized oxidoreductase